MNIIYCRVWSKTLGTWVVASELAKGGKKKSRSAASAVACAVTFLVLVGVAPPALSAEENTYCVNNVTAGGFRCGSANSIPTGDLTYGTAVGYGADATGSYGTALGAKAQAAGTSATALGYDSSASTYSTAVGTLSKANGSESVAIGENANAGGVGAIALGGAFTATSAARAAATDAIAIGREAAVTATSAGSIAIGNNAKANALDTVALGQSATASAQYASAFGDSANASAISATAVGYLATASGLRSTSAGTESDATGDESVAVGEFAQATAAGAIALGAGTSAAAAAHANAIDSIAIGRGAGVGAANTSGIAFGRGATVNGAFGIAQGDGAVSGATGRNVAIGSTGTTANGSSAAGGAVAIGRAQTATGNGAVAIGDPNTATGTGAVAVGADNNANGQGAVALGNLNTATGQGSVALGNASSAGAAGAVAIGDGASAGIARSVALGSGSATAAAVGTASTVIRGTTYNFAGTAPTSTVSVGTAGAERTVTNVAAGRLSGTSTDAVNGSQLFATNQAIQAAGAGFNVTAQGLNSSNVAPGEAVDLRSADGNIVVSKTAAADNVTFDLADDITVNSVTAGATTLNTNGLTITGGPSVTAAGINAGSKVITNVTAGSAGTDAVNVTQLNTAVSGATTQGLNFTGNDATAGTVHRDLGQTLSIRGTASTAGIYSGANLKTVTDPATGAINLQLAESPKFGNIVINDGGSGRVSGVTAGTAATDAVNKSQLDAVGATANAGFNVSAQGANATNVAPGQTVDLNNTDGNIIVRKTGTDANVSFELADDITVNSVAAGNSKLDNNGLVITGGPSVTSAGINAGNQIISNVAAGVAATDGVNKSQLDAVGATANAGFNVSAQGANATNVAPGQTVDLNNTDGNIIVSKTGTDDNVSFELADDITVNSVAAGNSKLDNNGLVITGGPSVTSAGINAGSQVITNVAAGVAATDGVNKSQLDAVGATANAGFNVSAQGANATNVAPGQTVDLNNTDGNIVVSKTGADDNVSFDLADDITVNSVTAGNSRLDNTGLVITGGPSVTSAGINAGSQIITNVAAGVAATDGVNKSQLDAVAGGSTSLGLNFTGNDATAGDVHRDLGQTLSIRGDATAAGTYSGGNIKTVTDPATGAISVQLADSPKFGNVVVNDGGTGKISGVTAADLSAASTDAISGSQLFQTNQDVAALGTRVTANEGDITALNNVVGPTDQAYQDANGHGVRYVRTNDTGQPESDAFATGANSTAIGYNARASAEEALAIGENSAASALSGLAIGSGSQATAQYAIAIGDNARASGNHSLAVGDEAAASGLFATSIGVLSNASGDYSSAMGIEAKASGRRSMALGHFANSSEELAIAIGADSQASHAGSVALGANAVANGATLGTAAYVPPASTYAVVGTAPVGEVSIGAAGSERRLTNVAAGAGDTDAANISQLKAVDSKITALGQDSLLWDPTANGGAGAYNANHGGTGPNKIVNIAPADLSAASTDAVNGSQLFQTNQDVAALDTRVTTAEGDISNLDNRVTTNEGDISNIKNQMGPTDPAYLQQNGRGTRYARTNDTGLAEDDAHAQVAGSTAVGYNAVSSAADAVAIGRNSQASHAGSVALGAYAIANGATLGTAAYVPPASTYAVAGTAPVGEVSVGAAGGERRLTNVAAGAGDTDAANISQLKAVDSKITSLGQDSLLWDPAANGGTGAYNANHLGAGPNKIVNVSPADLSVASTDAVNGSQLFKTNQDVAALDSRVTTNEGDITNIKNQMGPTDPAYLQQNGRGTRYARTNDTGLAEDDAHAQGIGSTAVGYNATSSAADAVAIGRGSQASHAGSVALGAGSVANGSTLANAAYLVGGTATGEVNVGSRRITGVAAGAEDTDAANVGQLKAVATSATQAEQRSVKYDWNDLDADGEIDPGEVDYGKATLAGPVSTDGGVTGGSKITNLAQGVVSATSTDAVNGAQLYQVAGPSDAAYVSQNGRGLRYARSNDTGLAEADAHAQGVGSSAVGYNATASAENAVAVGRDSVAGHANSVALGAGSSTTVGAQSGYNAAYVGSSNSTGQVQVGGRTIAGVAAGSAADDAVNVAQLQAGVNDAVTQANSYTDTRVDQIAGNVAQYDNRISAVESEVNNVKNGSAGLFQVSQDNTAAPTVSGTNASAGGAGAVASGAGSTALGNGAIASANNAVALGAGSVANQEGTVSVGSAGNERRVSNVAAGTSDTDAVNVAQLKGFTTGGLQYDKNADGSNNTNSVTFNPNGSGETTLRNVAAGKAPTDAVNVSQLGQAVTTANSYTDSQVATVRNDVWKLGGDVRRLERNMHSGIATAIAIKPAPYVAGRTTYYAGFGAYKSEAAFGVSLRHTADNGRWSLEGGASSNSDGIGAYIGVSGVLGD
jgi:autotransporter adhesin